MGGSSGANFSKSYVPDFYHSQTPMYPSFGVNIDYQDITDFMAVTSISSPTFSPHISDYVLITLAPMRPVVDEDEDDDDDDDAPQNRNEIDDHRGVTSRPHPNMDKNCIEDNFM
ncbi:hypothetical protein V6N13_000852 [Hibiscus sabdariffa]